MACGIPLLIALVAIVGAFYCYTVTKRKQKNNTEGIQLNSTCVDEVLLQIAYIQRAQKPSV